MCVETTFKKCKKSALFFSILPLEWQDIIIPQWEHYKDASIIYVLKENKKVIAGGIVFSKTPPNATLLELEYDYLFEYGYRYLGFIFVLPEYRNKKLASKWLEALKSLDKTQKFWLTIEEYALKSFYEKNEFKIIDESTSSKYKEWVLVLT
ncbi:GNAT family N-acetyltransferase [Flavivirga sp. 57AJ16]|uniref:GNAT family N-acetyltransferase n=1 Tax=Flavivirga sp. 57AJ16 TaxID=3025307 RepID=UPI002365A6DA|nr:GNAT family N-acetyltransferase [Flavivirga sp. 57AJ16]MDD7886066.1 GNAT family N-acetyltransferase [Flavivirga sp. 57AJ16]